MRVEKNDNFLVRKLFPCCLNSFRYSCRMMCVIIIKCGSSRQKTPIFKPPPTTFECGKREIYCFLGNTGSKCPRRHFGGAGILLIELTGHQKLWHLFLEI